MVDAKMVTYWQCGECGNEFDTEEGAEACCQEEEEKEE